MDLEGESGTMAMGGTMKAVAEKTSQLNPIIPQGDPAGTYTELVTKGKISDGCLRESGEGVCYMAEKGCPGARDIGIFDEYCWNNCLACPDYEERRGK